MEWCEFIQAGFTLYLRVKIPLFGHAQADQEAKTELGFIPIMGIF